MAYSALVSIPFLLLFSRSIQAAEDDCVPIETLFQQNIIEVNVNGTNIGGYNSTGAIDIWSDNPLYMGSLYGDLVGTSSGKCTLLTNFTEFMCSAIMKISENDKITFAGLSPNNNDRGELAITGGTGCYEEATGTLFMTAGEDYSSYLYEFEPGTVGSDCVSIEDLIGDGFVEENSGGSVVGDFEMPGSKDIWAGNILKDLSGNEVGKSYGDCTLLPGAETWMCIGAWVLNDTGGVITFAGHSPNNHMDEGILAITGGTGCHAGTHATLTLQAANEEYTTYDWKFVDPPSAGECKTLLDAVGGSTVFQENSGGETLGDYETPGSVDYWFGNKLYSGSHDGAEIEGAFSVGECTLLVNATEFMCLEQWKVDDIGSTIVATGFSPNSFEGGTLAISGTGCFTGIKGEMSITAESIVKDYDYFSYIIKSTNEESTDIEGKPAMETATDSTTAVPTAELETEGETVDTDGNEDEASGDETEDKGTSDGTESSAACIFNPSLAAYFVVAVTIFF